VFSGLKSLRCEVKRRAAMRSGVPWRDALRCAVLRCDEAWDDKWTNEPLRCDAQSGALLCEAMPRAVARCGVLRCGG
jgi:hypothetical protein